MPWQWPFVRDRRVALRRTFDICSTCHASAWEHVPTFIEGAEPDPYIEGGFRICQLCDARRMISNLMQTLGRHGVELDADRAKVI